MAHSSIQSLNLLVSVSDPLVGRQNQHRLYYVVQAVGAMLRAGLDPEFAPDRYF